jgi:DNA-binding XRE family transcriptional regulator
VSLRDDKKELEHVRSLLESMALLETVAADREANVEEVLGFLASHGMTGPELAKRLDISEESVRVLLERDEPKPPHERIGISEESVEKLTPSLPTA